ncbi:hypothetical protein LX64_04175 [Chitinophaga skermanii]|uniref:Uncharacterized protein n=1 Tax=Chitinophaga skermanii TaxID=331697 RepID=A0A327Q7J1_9BACT|nr:hypothetical protein [Chitinophaga skermanii]RAJ00469.1 hypothetical protein LX64_04175 [Chitinophaga skermanii]
MYPKIEDFNGNNQVDKVEGNIKTTYVLLENNRIAAVREGTGADVEKATLLSNGNQSKYFSALMSCTIEIDNTPLFMDDLAALKMRDYMALTVAFSNLNF